MKEVKAQLMLIVKQMSVFCEEGERISNTDLLEICRNVGVDLFSRDKTAHLIHELFETALNELICKKFLGSKIENQQIRQNVFRVYGS